MRLRKAWTDGSPRDVMPDLIAQGTAADHRWRKALPDLSTGRAVLLGRKPDVSIINARNPSVAWTITWDRLISRHHATLTRLPSDRVRVTRDARASNPIFYRGRPRDQFTLVPGEHFVIGGTTFTLARRPGFAGGSDAESSRQPGAPAQHNNASKDDQVAVDRHQVTEWTFAETALRDRAFRDADSRIELLARLPDLVSGSSGEQELLARVTEMLMRATPAASAVGIVTLNDILHYDSRDQSSSPTHISSRLVTAAIQSGQSILHVWRSGDDASAFTMAENTDWAFCVPLRSPACEGWALYVTGCRMDVPMQSDANNALVDRLSDDLKFAEVVGSLVAGMRQSGQLQQQQSAMRRFFAPVVLDALTSPPDHRRSADDDPSADGPSQSQNDASPIDNWLHPQECDLTVMFCDLRGFTSKSEEHAGELLRLLEQVSNALGVMTRHILNTGGVIGDFHGDAAMGFWGWPLPMGEDDGAAGNAAMAAAQAAKAIRVDYASTKTDFRCGIGLASGPAVAGRIGTVDQVKVTAFGPVVNLASRLESLTKAFGVEVLLDQTTVERLSTVTDSRSTVRYLGRVQIAGLSHPVGVSELLVGGTETTLTPSQIQTYQECWQAFADGQWEQAYQGLHSLPAWDRPKDVLMRTILQHQRVAPPDWDGVLRFPKNS
ncbi:MAG: adenylate/guanylate cyclase domain-containing protein [Planctomycetota bacterium]